MLERFVKVSDEEPSMKVDRICYISQIGIFSDFLLDATLNEKPSERYKLANRLETSRH